MTRCARPFCPYPLLSSCPSISRRCSIRHPPPALLALAESKDIRHGAAGDGLYLAPGNAGIVYPFLRLPEYCLRFLEYAKSDMTMRRPGDWPDAAFCENAQSLYENRYNVFKFFVFYFSLFLWLNILKQRAKMQSILHQFIKIKEAELWRQKLRNG